MRSVLRQRNFGLLWLAGLISLAGDWMLLIALPIHVYQLTGSALATSGVAIAGRIPTVVLGSVAGVFVDRWDRQRTMVIVNLARAPLLLGLLAVRSPNDLWLVYVIAFALSALGQFFSPAENALLPRLVGERDLIPANALNALNNNLARLAGPPLGGLLAATVGLAGVALADAATFLVAAVLIALIRSQTHDAPAAAGTPPEHRPNPLAALWREWRAGLDLIRRNLTLRLVFAMEAVMSLGEGVFGVLIILYVTEVLTGGAPLLGWLMAAQAIGGLVGATLIGRAGASWTAARLLGWGSLGIGIVDLVIFNYPVLFPFAWPAIALFVLVGVPVSACMTGRAALLQEQVADAFRGRVFGALNTTMGLLVIVGASIAGLLAGRLGVLTVLNVQGIAYAAAGAIALIMLPRLVLAQRSAVTSSLSRGYPDLSPDRLAADQID